jgi:hypothetical protein
MNKWSLKKIRNYIERPIRLLNSVRHARSPLSQAQIWVVDKPDRKTSIKLPPTDGSTITFPVIIVKRKVIYVAYVLPHPP